MKRPLIVGVMGGGTASGKDMKTAGELGRLIAREGWILLSGGRNVGIMEASLKGAFNAGGTTVGILPDDSMEKASSYLTIPILTGMGQARNVINALSSDVVVACSGGAGTISEICFALKHKKHVILLNFDIEPALKYLDADKRLHKAATADEAIAIIRDLNLSPK